MTGMKIVTDIPLHGEDAPPKADERFVVICDGLGSGSTSVEFNGNVHTSAYYGSRLVSNTVCTYFKRNYERLFDPTQRDAAISGLRDRIISNQKMFEKIANIERPNIGGSMFRLLPTTLASMIFRENEDSVEVICVWVGDSRCFVMDPVNGLRQISDDDIAMEKDPMGGYLEDSPMNNSISLGREFRLNYTAYTFRKPCMLFAASDGCFGYVKSPMGFERILLPTESDENFVLSDRIKNELSPIRQDDRSLAGVCFGIEDDENYKEVFKDRSDYMSREYYSKMVYDSEIDRLKFELDKARSLPRGTIERREAMDAVKTELKPLEKKNVELLLEMWDVYKETYDSLRVQCHREKLERIEKEKTDNDGNFNQDKKVVKTGNGSEDNTEGPESMEKGKPESEKKIPEEKKEPEIGETPRESKGPAPTVKYDPATEKKPVDMIEKPIVRKIPVESVTVSRKIPERALRPDPMAPLLEKLSKIGTVADYKIDKNTLCSRGYYVEAICTKKTLRKSDTKYRAIFSPRTDSNDHRCNMIGKKAFQSICAESGVLLIPTRIYKSDDYVMMTFVDSFPNVDLVYRPEGMDGLGVEESIDIIVKLLEALNLLHSKRIVHGGINQNNVRISTNGDRTECRVINYYKTYEIDNYRTEIEGYIRKEGTSYDIECAVMLMFNMSSESKDEHRENVERLKAILSETDNQVYKILLDLIDKRNGMTTPRAIDELRRIRRLRTTS